MTKKLMKVQETFRGEHPSGLEDKDEIVRVSAEFYANIAPELSHISNLDETFQHLLTFQQGWKACKDFYKISD